MEKLAEIVEFDFYEGCPELPRPRTAPKIRNFGVFEVNFRRILGGFVANFRRILGGNFGIFAFILTILTKQRQKCFIKFKF